MTHRHKTENNTQQQHQQQLPAKNRTDNSSSNAETSSDSSSSSLSAPSSTISATLSRLIFPFRGCSDEKAPTEDATAEDDVEPQSKNRKLTQVSFTEGSLNRDNNKQAAVEVAAGQRCKLRSNNASNHHNNANEGEEDVRLVSPPALELSSESDITTDDEQHKEEERKHASDDEEYKEEDNSGHDDDDDDDEILASETVPEPGTKQQRQPQPYQTRARRIATTKPPASEQSKNSKESTSTSEQPTTRMSTRYKGTRTPSVFKGEENSTSRKKNEPAKCLKEGLSEVRVRLKMKEMRSLCMLDAIIGKEGIPGRRQTRRAHGIHIEPPKRFIEVDSYEGWPSSFSHHHERDHVEGKQKNEHGDMPSRKRSRSQMMQVAEMKSSPVRRSNRTRTCRADSYEEPAEKEIVEMEEAVWVDEADEAKPTFVLDTSNKLSATRLVTEYEDVCLKQHGTCVALNGFHGDDESAKEAVSSLLEECETFNSKLNPSEEDEDLIAERQLAGRSMRIIQGRMNQEIIARIKEKEQAELLAIELAYQWKNKKRHALTVNEMEWEAIQDRPVYFAPKNVRMHSRTNGSTNCPSAPKNTRSRSGNPVTTTAEEEEPCQLCRNPDEEEDSKPPANLKKNMVPLFRTIDVDAPDFEDRDLDEEELEKKKAAEKDSKPTRKTRGTNRLRNDHRARQETMMKLSELKHSIDFVDQYNSGLIREKLKECRK